MILASDAAKLPFADDSFDLILGSPPYADARSYGISAERNCHDWIAWMLHVTAEAVRVSRGLVIWIVAGVTRKWCYWPGPEGLLYEWWRQGGHCWRPAYWHRVGIPGSGGKQWLRADIEYALCFTNCEGAIPWADNTANGHPPKWAPGGDKKVRRCTRGSKNGHTIQEDKYVPPPLANPGCLIQGIKVGGGAMGHSLAHKNEAPFPMKLARWFIEGWCPPNGLVLDPFVGSGTTLHAASVCGRKAVGCDIRLSQCVLAAQRIAEVQLEMF